MARRKRKNRKQKKNDQPREEIKTPDEADDPDEMNTESAQEDADSVEADTPVAIESQKDGTDEVSIETPSETAEAEEEAAEEIESEDGDDEAGLLTDEELEDIDDEKEEAELEIEIAGESADSDDGLLEGEILENDSSDDDEDETDPPEAEADQSPEAKDITIAQLEQLDKGMKVIEIDIARPEDDEDGDSGSGEPQVMKTVVEPHILKVVSQEEPKQEEEEDSTVSQVNIGQAGSIADQLEAIDYLFLRVNEPAIKKLFESAKFRNLFENSDTRDTVIMHVNLRRSADLMLHAKNPLLYLDFMMKLESTLRETIILNYGVFEKFTGDGLIAFFPDFYSGREAMCFAVKAADECQSFFKEHYRKYRNSFSTIVLEAGLCIGIDFGKANIIKVNEELMSVGEPVVNARKMSSGNAGETILNQAAFDELRRRHKGQMDYVETEVDFAGKGRVLGYKAAVNWAEVNLEDPDWDSLLKDAGD